ncbi:MAG: hypothetical protein II594_05770 [Clostridium sp.]|nr:hypothetical protein [Clostridium sp.]
MSDMRQYPGMVCLRELPVGLVDWDKVEKNLKGAFGFDVIRLHLELMREHPEYMDPSDDGRPIPVPDDEYSTEETRVLKNYGNVQYGETITRDILIPGDMPLYAIHYMILAAFGFQNGHLHRFELPHRQFLNVTDNQAAKWAEFVGVLFRSPWMDNADLYWSEDYEKGSFRNWRRKKYTGPYVSLCHGEGIIQCKEDIKEMKKKVLRGKKNISMRELQDLFMEAGINHLLERLEIGEVLALHGKDLEDNLAEGEEIPESFDAFMDEDLRYDIREILKSGEDSPLNQPVIGTPTDVLYYFYDFGDGWRIRITGSYDVCDLVEAGRVTEHQIEEAMKKVYETWQPVCIAADGLPLVEDVGGLSGYTAFLRAIHPTEERSYWAEHPKEQRPDNGPYETKQESLAWAKGLGWKDKVRVETLL